MRPFLSDQDVICHPQEVEVDEVVIQLLEDAFNGDVDALWEILKGYRFDDMDADYTQRMLVFLPWDSERLQLFIRKGGNIHMVNENGLTSLHLAVLAGKYSLVKLLLEAGADANAQDNSGMAALHFAAWLMKSVSAELLLKAGADFDLQDRSGRTALHIAAATGDTTVIKALLKAGADVTVVDNNGRTAEKLARDRMHISAFKLLRGEPEYVICDGPCVGYIDIQPSKN